ncbi:helix-turn-helix domain-containing protein [Nakamurella leprariae]|uniref:Helix-turn-helix transcriptional regulator n=1 Tax=Nakamurella leprariae TaxID=2803911 RepID=A0A939C0J3_9ACTN|nr:XRE family transcriptional regulator [Nakamurella leprariae]MBM9468821.1 helix-turn-helix transcriptional regulator [Nakamurella leprariae]
MPRTDRAADPDLELAGRIGARVRTVREQAGLSMRALAERGGVSQPFLSQLERGLTSPSMATLYRLAAALGLPPGDLLPGAGAAEAGRVVLTPAGSGRTLAIGDAPDAALGRALLLEPDEALEVLDYDIAAGQQVGEWFAGPGPTCVYLLAGRLDIEFDPPTTLDGAAGMTDRLVAPGTVRLRPGDFLTHPGAVPHRWSTVQGGAARVLLIARRTG